MKLTDLTIIIPAYNEEKTIQKVLEKVLALNVGEILVVDDGSLDKTVEIVGKIKNRKIKLIKHKNNKGKGGAICTGIKNANKKYLTIQDADLELNPKDIIKLFNKVSENNFVIGNRWKKFHKYTSTRFGNHLISSLVFVLYGKIIYDPYCCYKMASTKKWRELKLNSTGFEIEAEIVGKILANTKNIQQVNVAYLPRSYKQGKKIRFNDLFVGLKTLMLMRFTSL